MFVFIVPVAFVQSMMQLDQLQKIFPTLKGVIKKSFFARVITGYLPSVVLLLSLYTVPPLMMLFSSIEGSISCSGRKEVHAAKFCSLPSGMSFLSMFSQDPYSIS
uniref:CSC1/OSCA1-like 7TM region domain-containing protein n=1 Tax=Arundo donax TaxID=35708 RepID=A0A0A8Z530_ARUDO